MHFLTEEDWKLYEYLGIIPPCADVFADVEEMKWQCKLNEGWEQAVMSKPHFTLFKFVQPLFNEAHFAGCLRRLAANTTSFNLSLSNFDYFDSTTCTLYIKSRNEQPFADFSKQIRLAFKSLLRSLEQYRPIYTSKAHLTIAKGVAPQDFVTAWPRWKNKKYQAACPAEQVRLLRRALHSNKPYEIVGDFPFLGEGDLGFQMKLF